MSVGAERVTALRPDCPPVTARLTSEIPVGAGLGSSAAMSVCFAAGLLLHRPGQAEQEQEKDLEPTTRNKICDWAFQAEVILHGTPSGIDNSVATHGGLLSYQAGELTPLAGLQGLTVLLTDTRVPRNTRQMVAAVRDRQTAFPRVLTPIMEAIEGVVVAALQTLQECRERSWRDCEAEYGRLNSLVDMNQSLLAALGVSHPALDNVVSMTGQQGLHTKLTGAGGGGVAVSLVTPATPAPALSIVTQQLEQAGYRCYSAEIGGAGVRAWRAGPHRTIQ